MSISEEKAIEYIRMILRNSKMSDAEKALGYVYATEALETLIEALKKKNKMIDELAPRIYLTKEERAQMKKRYMELL